MLLLCDIVGSIANVLKELDLRLSFYIKVLQFENTQHPIELIFSVNLVYIFQYHNHLNNNQLKKHILFRLT